jgi:hypothetical protein
MSLLGLVPEKRRGCWLSSTAEQHCDYDRVIDQPADLKSSSCMAVIISSHRRTVAMMNSIHTLLSENHPCTLFMASLHPGYHAPPNPIHYHILRLTTNLEPYLYLRQRQAVRTVIPTPQPNRWSVLCSHLAASQSRLACWPWELLAPMQARAGGSPIRPYLPRT